MATRINIKRVYEKPSKKDGQRILVDRLWPRGLTKRRAAVDLWMKNVAPSTELRKWFSHDPVKWKGFQQRYRKELRNGATIELLKQKCRKGIITLLYGAKDEQHNEAIVLKKLLDRSNTGKSNLNSNQKSLRIKLRAGKNLKLRSHGRRHTRNSKKVR